MWRRAMTYLGLGPDDEYDDYDDVEPLREPAGRAPAERVPSRAGGGGRHGDAEPAEVSYVGSVRRLEAQPVEPTSGIGTVKRGSPVVRPLPVTATAKPQVIQPTSFADAQELADRLKGNVPVIMNLQGVDRDLLRRLIDFASGLCYGVGGTMERVAQQVYLLTPSNVEVSAEERRRLQERGLVD